MEIAPFITTFFHRSIYIVLPFAITLALIYILQKLAPALGFVDKPDQRKNHSGNVPLVGGPAMFLAIAVAASLLVPQFQVLIFLALSACMMLLGLLDDRLDLPAWFRLLIQASVASCMAYFALVSIMSVGNLTGSGPVQFNGTSSILVTIVCTIGAINAINMIDGVDGLAGSILAISFSSMAWLAWRGSDLVSAELLTIFVGAIAGFLAFNARIFVPQARVFMGDSGSMFLGFILVWFLIQLTQTEQATVSPVVAGWIFGLPLLDTVSVMVGRIRARRHIFSAGRDHFHHKLLDSGLSVNQTVLCATVVHLLFVTVGVVANDYRVLEPALFWGFVACVIAHHFFTPIVLNRLTAKIAR